MKLRDYPLIFRAFKEINLNSSYRPGMYVDGNADVPERWLIPFAACEDTFRKCTDRTVSSVPTLETRVDDYNGDLPLWQVIALPVDEDDLIVMRFILCSPEAAWLTQHVLHEFFDGELSGVFYGGQRE